MTRARFLRCLVIALAITGAAYLAMQLRARADAPIPSSGGALDLDLTIAGIPYWQQGDPAWAREALGGSQEPMAAAGCTLTSTAMALATSGQQLTPLELCRALKAHQGFTAQGQLIWSAVSDVTGGKVRVTFPPLSYDEIDGALRRQVPVITKILLGEEVPHWVLIVGKHGADYLAMDPLSPDRTVVRLSRLAARIHAIRILQRL